MHTPHSAQKMTAAIFCPNVTGGTSGSSVSSTVGMPVTKSISSGRQNLVRLMNLYPTKRMMKSGMLMSTEGINKIRAQGTASNEKNEDTHRR